MRHEHSNRKNSLPGQVIAPMRTPSQTTLTYLLVFALLVIMALLLYVNSRGRYEDFAESQQALMEKSARDTVQTLGIYIEQTRRLVGLFASRERENIRLLSIDPDNNVAREELEARLEQYIPDFFAFTIADASGAPLLDDFEGNVGEVCRTDIRNFSHSKHPQELFIHPNPLQYHFDIMTPVKLAGNKPGVFFVSFKPDVLGQLLKNSELPDHQLLLLHSDDVGLIEITAEGARDDIEREIHLSEQETESIDIQFDVPGSLWELVYLPDTELFKSVRRQMLLYAELEYLVILLFSVVMLAFIRREESKREDAEQALQESHDLLEKKVEERTRELKGTNLHLQEEVIERSRAQHSLRKSEQRYALAAKGANDGIWEWDAESNSIFFSQRWLQMVGKHEDEGEGSLSDWLHQIDKEDRGLFMSAFENAIQGGADYIDLDLRMADREGTTRWFHCRGAVAKDAQGRPVRIAGSLTDITQQREAGQQD
jgi:PAS domain S-box-containing protein